VRDVQQARLAGAWESPTKWEPISIEQRLGTTIGAMDRYIVRLVRNNTGTAARNNILAMAT
jgi:hypothetical protein